MPPRTKGFDTPQLTKLRSAIDNGTGRPTLCDASGAKRKILIKDNGYTTGRGGAVFRHGKEIIADDDNGDIRLGREAASLANGMAAEAGKILLEIDLGVIVQSLTELYWLSAETEARLPGIVRRAVVEELMARNNTNSAAAAVDAAAAPNVLGRRNLLPSFDVTGAAAADVATMLVERMEHMTAIQEKTVEHQKQTTEHQKQTTLVQDKLWEKVEEHGGDIATLKRQMGEICVRLKAVEASVGSPPGVAARGAFSFDGAATGGDKKRPALASVAPAVGGGFGFGTTVAATTAGIPPQGFAAPVPFAGTATVLGSDNAANAAAVATTASAATSPKGSDEHSVATVQISNKGAGNQKPTGKLSCDDSVRTLQTSSHKSSSGGGILTFGSGAGSAGAGAGIDGAGFFFNSPTDGSFGAPKNSALSAAPSVSFGTQESSRKDAIGFLQVSIKAFFLSCYLYLPPH